MRGVAPEERYENLLGTIIYMAEENGFDGWRNRRRRRGVDRRHQDELANRAVISIMCLVLVRRRVLVCGVMVVFAAIVIAAMQHVHSGKDQRPADEQQEQDDIQKFCQSLGHKKHQ